MSKKPKGRRPILRPDPENPRRISDAALEALKASLAEFGDLSGVVYNRTTKTLVSGHQRAKTFNAEDAQITVLHESPEPDEHGTVIWGTITADGQVLSYREVEWPEAKAKAAMIAANRHGGDWDAVLLQQALADLDGELKALTGFTDQEVEDLLAKAELPTATEPPQEAEGAEERTAKPFSPVIKYDLVFEDVDQQNQWFDFLRNLKIRYPEEETVSGRVCRFLNVVNYGADEG